MRTAQLLLPVVAAGLAFVAPGPAASVAAGAERETNLTARAIDLGTLGGKQSVATAVDGSLVVGWSQTPVRSTRHAFAYDLSAAEPTMLDLGSVRGRSEAEDVDGSVVVGEFNSASEGNFGAFAYDLAAANPTMRDLGTLGGSYAIARAVSGTIVVGMSETAGGETHAFAYDLVAAEPAMRDLGTLGGRASDAVAVDGNIVVGDSTTASGELHAFAYDLSDPDPTMVDLGSLGGQYGSYASAIDGPLVTGSSDTASGNNHAFAYDLSAADPVMQDLGTLGGPDSMGRDVSGSTIVGASDTAPGKWRAFAYDVAAAEPAMRDLGTVAGGEAQTWVDAMGIDGDLVIGSWAEHAFAYDLAARQPRMLDLSTWRGMSWASDIDGDVVVGASDRGPADRATAWVLRETTRPLFAFKTVERRVREDVGRVTIRVTRYGRTDRAVSVRYQTHHDTAVTGKDFVGTSGKLRFAAGVTQRKFRVKILDDWRDEPAEYLLVGLSHPSEPARIGRLGWSQVRIDVSDR